MDVKFNSKALKAKIGSGVLFGPRTTFLRSLDVTIPWIKTTTTYSFSPSLQLGIGWNTKEKCPDMMLALSWGKPLAPFQTTYGVSTHVANSVKLGP